VLLGAGEECLPTFLGWNLLAISTVGVVLEPISGFWLLMLPAFLIILDHDSYQSTKP